MRIIIYESSIVLPCFWESAFRGEEVSDPKQHGQFWPILMGLQMIELPAVTARVSIFASRIGRDKWYFRKQIRVQITTPPTEMNELVIIWNGKVSFERNSGTGEDIAVFWKNFFTERLIEERTAAEKRIAALARN